MNMSGYIPYIYIVAEELKTVTYATPYYGGTQKEKKEYSLTYATLAVFDNIKIHTHIHVQHTSYTRVLPAIGLKPR